MYTEEPRTIINWRNVLRKGLLVVLIILIVLLFIWLITGKGIRTNFNGINNNNSNITNTSKKNNKNNNNNTNVIIDDDSSTLNKTIYSESFITNYGYVHSSAKDYLVTNTLPSDGQTIKYTVKELIDKDVLLQAKYGNSTCDYEASYVMITNNGGKYYMTTTLVCGNEVAKTTEELKCNNLCDGKCQDEEEDVDYVLKYEYKRLVNKKYNTYSCPSGYTKTGSGANTSCVKGTSATVKPTVNTTHSCPAGYTKTGIGSNTKCTSTTDKNVDPTKKTTYSCPAGSTKSGSGANTVCTVKDSYTVKATKKVTNYCPNDYSFANGRCYKDTSESYNATKIYSCPEGTLSGGKCIIYSTTKVNATPYTTYSCAQGSLVNTKYCRIFSTSSHVETYTTYHNSTYNGCTYSGTATEVCYDYTGCKRTVYKYSCTATTYRDVLASANTSYKCSQGTLSGNQCVITTSRTVDANVSYTCSKGVLKGDKCIVTSSDSVAATQSVEYKCSKGKLSGTNCIIDDSYTVPYNKDVTYTCPSGYTKSGSGANTMCTIKANTTVGATVNSTYTCPTGYTKSGLGSGATCTINNTETVKPTVTTKTESKYEYTWSTNDNLPGWIKTGNTKKITSMVSTMTSSIEK